MKKRLSTLIICLFVVSMASASQTMNQPSLHAWYGFDPLVSSGHAWDGGSMDDDDDNVYRKRRHRRKRKISPPRKGW